MLMTAFVCLGPDKNSSDAPRWLTSNCGIRRAHHEEQASTKQSRFIRCKNDWWPNKKQIVCSAFICALSDAVEFTNKEEACSFWNRFKYRIEWHKPKTYPLSTLVSLDRKQSENGNLRLLNLMHVRLLKCPFSVQVIPVAWLGHHITWIFFL